MSRFLSSTDKHAFTADLAALVGKKQQREQWSSTPKTRRRHHELRVIEELSGQRPDSSPRPAKAESPILRADSLTFSSPHLAARLGTFIAWMRPLPSLEACFVADEQGLPLITAGAFDYSPLSSVLQNALGQVRSAVGASTTGEISLSLGEGKLLQLLECRQVLGSFSLGLVTTQRVGQDQMEQLQLALQKTLANDV